MRSPRLARALMAATAAAALAMSGAAPAFAQAQPTLKAYVNDVTIPTAGPGVVERITLTPSAPMVIENPVITFDYTAIASFATVTRGDQGMSWNCTLAQPAVLTCKDVFAISVNSATGILPEFVIAPTASAALGNEGVLKVTVKGDDVAPVSTEARVRTGAPADLAVVDSNGPDQPDELEVAFGAPFTHTLKVKNVGETAINGVGLMLFNDAAFRASAKFSNCTYAGDQPRTCQFDRVLNPNTTYQLVLPYVTGPDTMAPSSYYAEFEWMTAANFEDELKRLATYDYDRGQPGPSGTLQLTEVSSVAARSVETDVDPTNNWASLSLTVTGTNDTDLAAIGASLTGGVGDQVVATVGMKNNGPASVDGSRAGTTVALVHVVIPPGTTAVTVPQACLPESEDGQTQGPAGQPGQPRYFCLGSTSYLAAGASDTFKITLRIDQVIPDAAGSVKILVPCQCQAFQDSIDRDHSNNAASITINSTTAAGGGHAAPALPNTGARIGWMVGLGGLLVLLGAFAVVWARRRSSVARVQH